MCSINHDLKVIFIHTPKCGGLFIEKVLERFYNFKTYYFTHENHDEFIKLNILKSNNSHGFLNITEKGVLNYFMSSEIHNKETNMTTEKWNSYKKFAVNRNPYDRFISALKYIYKTNNTNFTFEDFVRNKLNDYNEQKFTNTNSYEYFHLFIPQYQHLIDVNDEFKIDYFINFQNLNKDFCYTLLELGVPKIKHRSILLDNRKINESEKNNNYHQYYDTKLINFVNDVFDIDFNKFNYNKCFTVEELTNDSLIYYQSPDQFCKNNINLLIELDAKNLIYNSEEINKMNLDLPTMNQNKITDKSIRNITDESIRNITLSNGIKINTNKIQKNIEENTSNNPNIPIVDKQFHLNNFLKLFEKLSKNNKKK